MVWDIFTKSGNATDTGLSEIIWLSTKFKMAAWAGWMFALSECFVVYATADEAVAYMFYRCFFCFFFVFVFSVHQNYETAVLGNGWTDFHETFTKRYRETWILKRRAAAWRMANVDLRNLRYDSAAGYGNPQSELCTLWLWRNHQRAPRTAVAL